MGLSSAAGCCGGESWEEDELLRNLLQLCKSDLLYREGVFGDIHCW